MTDSEVTAFMSEIKRLNGADVWLASLGIGIRPSMRKALMEVEL